MKKRLLILFLYGVAALMCGCHFIPDIMFYNNSSLDLSITAYHGDTKNGNTDTFALKSGQVDHLGAPYKFEVHFKDGIWYYQMRVIPMEFWQNVGGNWRRANLQIQNDGTIYLLLPGATSAADVFPKQPEGFPLKPTTKNESPSQL